MNTMMAAIAPGPASSGVPSRTNATLDLASPARLASSPRSRSSATTSSSSPPAICKLGTEIPR
jgi:hypothetical protein